MKILSGKVSSLVNRLCDQRENTQSFYACVPRLESKGSYVVSY